MSTMHIPQLRAGDSAAFSVSIPSEAGRAVSLVLVGPVSITITTTERASEPGVFDITLTSATTSTYQAGSYRAHVVSLSGGDRRTIDFCVVEILPDVTVMAAPFDTRSHAVRMLDAIRARLEGRITADAESYSIRGRALSRIPMAELIKLRSQYEAEVYRERVAAGLVPPARIRPVFVR